MRLTRRNTIIGLGTLAAGAGVIGGSGAFDQVQAERGFSVGVADDSAALLKLEANGNSEITTTTQSGTANDNNVLAIQPSGEDLNDKAITIFEDAFSITNNGNDNVGVSINPVDSGGNDVPKPGIAFSVSTPPGDNDNNPELNDPLTHDKDVLLRTGESIDVAIKFDTGAVNGLDGTYQPGRVSSVIITAATGDATTPSQ